jgi:hypothetical protein
MVVVRNMGKHYRFLLMVSLETLNVSASFSGCTTRDNTTPPTPQTIDEITTTIMNDFTTWASIFLEQPLGHVNNVPKSEPSVYFRNRYTFQHGIQHARECRSEIITDIAQWIAR